MLKQYCVCERNDVKTSQRLRCQAAVTAAMFWKLKHFLLWKPLINDYGILRLNHTIRKTF